MSFLADETSNVYLKLLYMLESSYSIFKSIIYHFFQSHSCANQIPSNRLEKKSQELVRVVNYLNSVKMQMNFEASKLAAAAGWSITLSSRHSHGFRISQKKACQKFANHNTFFIMKNAKRHPLQHLCNEYNFFSAKYVDFKTRLNCG